MQRADNRNADNGKEMDERLNSSEKELPPTMCMFNLNLVNYF